MHNKYLPFITGTYSTAPGLVAMNRQKNDFDKLVFQIDDSYFTYYENKLKCRNENIHKYYVQHNLPKQTAFVINHYIINTLQKEHPEKFEYTESGNYCTFLNILSGELIEWNRDNMKLSGDKYLSLFDALCSQAQEDFAICQIENETDWQAAIHLCAPNHWAAQDKIGKSFSAAHAPVPGMEKTLTNYPKLLHSIIHKGPFTRYAWGISTDKRLNHHPVAPENNNIEQWHGRKIDNDDTVLYVRTERQNLIGFPEVNAFLFTIRTYFYEVEALSNIEKKALLSAVKTMHPQSLEYKGLNGFEQLLKKKL